MILIFLSPLHSKAAFTFEFIPTSKHIQIRRFLIKQEQEKSAKTAIVRWFYLINFSVIW